MTFFFLQACQGELSLDHFHRRDRRHRHQAFRRPDWRRPRSPADPPRTPQPDGRLRPDDQRQGHHGHQQAGHPRPRPTQAGQARQENRVPSARQETGK